MLYVVQRTDCARMAVADDIDPAYAAAFARARAAGVEAVAHAADEIIQLKATPLVATISAIDTYAVFGRIRQETYIVYEPLLLMALIYLVIAGLITLGFRTLEKRHAS